ncbi:hypothetical protein KKA15_06890 [Patescibacteria group bacterium]|nr:hypothetical protein [Patescibacteria group bacterium]
MTDEIKKQIMAKVSKDEIKMTSKWVFIAKKLGLHSGMALTIIVIIFLLNAFFYYIKSNDLLLSLHYGPAVWQKFLHSLPYELILTIIVLVVLLNYFIKQFDFSYKKPFLTIFLLFVGIIIVFASLIFITNFNFYLKQNLSSTNIKIPYISNFYINRCGHCVEADPNCNLINN